MLRYFNNIRKIQGILLTVIKAWIKKYLKNLSSDMPKHNKISIYFKGCIVEINSISILLPLIELQILQILLLQSWSIFFKDKILKRTGGFDSYRLKKVLDNKSFYISIKTVQSLKYNIKYKDRDVY